MSAFASVRWLVESGFFFRGLREVAVLDILSNGKYLLSGGDLSSCHTDGKDQTERRNASYVKPYCTFWLAAGSARTALYCP